MPVTFKIKQNSNGLNMGIGERKDISPNQDKGILKELVREGLGDEYPNYSDTVSLKYTAYYGDQVDQQHVFDSSEADGNTHFVYSCLKGKTKLWLWCIPQKGYFDLG